MLIFRTKISENIGWHGSWLDVHHKDCYCMWIVVMNDTWALMHRVSDVCNVLNVQWMASEIYSGYHLCIIQLLVGSRSPNRIGGFSRSKHSLQHFAHAWQASWKSLWGNCVESLLGLWTLVLCALTSMPQPNFPWCINLIRKHLMDSARHFADRQDVRIELTNTQVTVWKTSWYRDAQYQMPTIFWDKATRLNSLNPVHALYWFMTNLRGQPSNTSFWVNVDPFGHVLGTTQ